MIKETILGATKYVGSGIEKSLSASSVGNEVCQNWLKQEYGIIDETEIGQNTLGSIFHLGMEKMFEGSAFDTEFAMHKKLGDYSITGTADLIDTKSNCIYDYKLTKNYTYKMWSKEPLTNGYTVQMNVLKWLAERTYPEKKFDMKLVWFLKDAVATKDEPNMIISEVPAIDIEPIIQAAVDELKGVLDVPPKCKDLWMRKVKGVNVPMKCKYYCSYNKVCPHYDEPVKLPTTW